MKLNKIALVSGLVVSGIAVSSFFARANAVLISGSQIIPSTALLSVPPFTIDQITDGITSDAPPYNGFVSNSASGTITLNLVNAFDLSSFILWNDINVNSEGIKDF